MAFAVVQKVILFWTVAIAFFILIVALDFKVRLDLLILGDLSHIIDNFLKPGVFMSKDLRNKGIIIDPYRNIGKLIYFAVLKIHLYKYGLAGVERHGALRILLEVVVELSDIRVA